MKYKVVQVRMTCCDCGGVQTKIENECNSHAAQNYVLVAAYDQPVGLPVIGGMPGAILIFAKN
jgi:hypothetical protein